MDYAFLVLLRSIGLGQIAVIVTLLHPNAQVARF